MATSADVRVPAHLWIIGILSLLWNAFGCYDYLMTETGNQAYLSQFPPEMMTYMESLPAWTTATWALGVWGGLIGAILLLMRNRYSVWAYAASLFGAVVGLGYQMFMTEVPASMKEGFMGIIPWLIIAIAAFQGWYSLQMDKKGVLH